MTKFFYFYLLDKILIFACTFKELKLITYAIFFNYAMQYLTNSFNYILNIIHFLQILYVKPEYMPILLNIRQKSKNNTIKVAFPVHQFLPKYDNTV